MLVCVHVWCHVCMRVCVLSD
uniref:Uncharacterized protein n=1 Tax=Anguilla anguilla TaxID=7936 RepID=A0A0E9XP40_ANGAN